jgi:glutathione S-transferase
VTAFTLVVGNKNYSSWSLRPWLAMRQAGIAFDEVVIPLYRPESKAAILAQSPAGKVPVLRRSGPRIRRHGHWHAASRRRCMPASRRCAAACR